MLLQKLKKTRSQRQLAKALSDVNRELDRAEKGVAQTEQRIISMQRRDLAGMVGKLDSTEIARREAELNHRSAAAQGW